MMALRFSRPLQLILAGLTYLLGVGMARYLGKSAGAPITLLGAMIIISVLAASGLLSAYFLPLTEPLFEGETPRTRVEQRRILMVVAAALLTVAAFMVILVGWQRALGLEVTALLVLFTLVCVAIGVPPLRLIGRGYGEIATALLLAGIIPALSFVLQTNSFNRLINVVTFPLCMLGLASLLALDFPAFAIDMKYERRTLLTRLGWQRAISLHNMLVAAAYLLFAAAPFFGFPFSLFWPSLLTIPLAGYQIFMLRNIGDGARPLWNALAINAISIFGLTVYFLSLTFWLR